MYNTYGPTGTDEIMVLALEHDQWNTLDEFMGIGDPWVTAGDWITGTPFPLFNVEDPDRGVFTDYNIASYPWVFKICSDKKVEIVSTSLTEAQTMRLVDRVLRPLFPKDYHAETQVMIQLMSHDDDVMPEAMAGLAASAAIQLSDFPFECAISEPRALRSGCFAL